MANAVIPVGNEKVMLSNNKRWIGAKNYTFSVTISLEQKRSEVNVTRIRKYYNFLNRADIPILINILKNNLKPKHIISIVYKNIAIF